MPIQQMVIAAALKGKDDRGSTVKLDPVNDAEEIIKEDLSGGKRVLNTTQLWKLVDSNNAFLMLMPGRGFIGRTDYNNLVIQEIQKKIKAIKKGK